MSSGGPTTRERDLLEFRQNFPVLADKTYLISASLGPISERARGYLEGYLDAWATIGAPEPLWFEWIFPQLARVKALLGELLHAHPSQLAIMLNVSHSISSVASALDFSGERKRVIVSELDFPTGAHIWLAQERRGAEVVFLPSPDSQTVPVEAYLEAIDERTALVCLNRVFTAPAPCSTSSRSAPRRVPPAPSA